MEQQDRTTEDVQETRALRIITTVAVVGTFLTARKILKTNKAALEVSRRSLDLASHVFDNHQVGIQQMADIITTAKKAGQTFEYFPGVGVWVD